MSYFLTYGTRRSKVTYFPRTGSVVRCNRRHNLTDSEGIPPVSVESGAFPFRIQGFSTKFRSFSIRRHQLSLDIGFPPAAFDVGFRKRILDIEDIGYLSQPTNPVFRAVHIHVTS